MKNIDEIVALFDAKPVANGWMARCPAHDDHNPSLSIARGDDGRILFKCFAGCDYEHILAAKGLAKADVCPTKPHVTHGESRTVAKYVYHDENGVPKYCVVRKEPKAFYQMKFGPHGELIPNMKDVARLPYCLPQLLNAAKAGETLYVVEGEKDVETMAHHGLVATCNSGGAGKWEEDFAEYFKGAKEVVVIADNDTEAKGFPGQKHALAVRKSLTAIGIPAIACVLPKGKDVSEYFADGGTAETLKDYLENPQPWPAAWENFTSAVVEKKEESPIPTGRFGRICDGEEEKEFPCYESVVDLEQGGSVHIRVCGESDSLIDAINKAKAKACEDAFAGNRKKGNPITCRDMLEITNIVIIMWYRSRGRFFYNERTNMGDDSMYFDNQTGKLRRINSDAFKFALSNGADLNREDKSFKRVYSLLQDAAMEPTVSIGTVPHAYNARVDDALYISCGPSKMVRVKNGKAEVVKNGVDNVVFSENAVYDEWTLLPETVEVSNPFESLRIFKNASYANSYGRMLLESWYLNIFAGHDTLAPLLITGEFRSGKTRMAKGVMEMLGCRVRIDDIDARKEEDFWVKVNNPGVVCFDNLEDEICQVKWFGSSLERSASEGMKDTRKLYTHEIYTYRTRANIILTSKCPRFAENAGLSDRLIILRLDQGRTISEDRELTKDIKAHRDEAMTWTARTLAKAMLERVELDDSLNLRHPDFSAFALRCARAIGKYESMLKAVKCGEFDKSLIVLKQEPFARVVFNVLMQSQGKWVGTGADLARMILESGETEIQDLNLLSTKVGRCLAAYRENFRVCFPGYYTTKSNGKMVHHFVGVNEYLLSDTD